MLSFFRSHGSDVSHGPGAVQGSFRATYGVASGVASVFVHVVSRSGWGAIGRCLFPSPSSFFRLFFGVNLDYLDFSGGIFDL